MFGRTSRLSSTKRVTQVEVNLQVKCKGDLPDWPFHYLPILLVEDPYFKADEVIRTELERGKAL